MRTPQLCLQTLLSVRARAYNAIFAKLMDQVCIIVDTE